MVHYLNVVKNSPRESHFLQLTIPEYMAICFTAAKRN